MHFISDILTESNNRVFSSNRVWQAVAVLTCVGGAINMMWTGHINPDFFPQFGAGIGLVLSGGAINAKFTPETPKDGE